MSELPTIAEGIADNGAEGLMAQQLAMRDDGGRGKVNVSLVTSGSLTAVQR